MSFRGEDVKKTMGFLRTLLTGTDKESKDAGKAAAEDVAGQVERHAGQPINPRGSLPGREGGGGSSRRGR
jgi:hypothetical protein